MMPEFSKILKKLICSQGWSVAEFARRAGVKPRIVYYWLRGDNLPSLSAFRAVLRIAKRYGKIGWFL